MPGFVLWFTGLSGSGKSTLATMVTAELARRSVHTEALDGDEIRRHLSRGLGFSREDRDENVRRIAFIARIVERCGACAIVSTISPYAATREEVRKLMKTFVLVFTECSMPELVRRDPKGLYKRALAGELTSFTGVSDLYEPPVLPDVHCYTHLETEAESLAKIVTHLEERALLARH
ncbi:MAG TPA: adenylyl-sulfate kinase [Polyangiaceae bacterium]|jgi:adenylyl-sulfate kinase|nr:adenylyl-sulfate kinase [Polyangiaceae bacterium]